MVEKVHLWDSRLWLEEVVSDPYQHVVESMTQLDVVSKEAWLGAVIAQLQNDNANLQELINPYTPPEQVAERKSTMEDLATQLDEMEQEAKNVTGATTQFWGRVVQDEKSKQMTTKL